MKSRILWTILFALLLFGCSFIIHIQNFVYDGWDSWVWWLVISVWIFSLGLIQIGYKIGFLDHCMKQYEVKMFIEHHIDEYRDSKKEEEEK